MADPVYVLREVDGEKQRDLLTHLQHECFPEDSLEDPGRGYWWVLTAGREPAGFCSIRDVKDTPGVGYLSRAGVLPTHRGRGLQRRLIRVRLRKARNVGWTRVITTTYDNPASSNNLIACGFRLYVPETPWGVEGTLYWTRTL